MKPSHFLSLFVGVLLLWFAQSCIEPFNANELPEARILVVESNISDLSSDQQYISLKYSRAQGLSIFDEYQAGSIVKIMIDGSQQIDLVEKTAGFYYLPPNFKVLKSKSYQLKFELNGQKYASLIEQLPVQAPSIDKIYQEFKPNSIAISATKLVSGHSIYVDYKDNLNEENFYSFKWKLWETQYYCKSCAGGEKYNPPQGCQRDPFSPTFFAYDYACGSPCWEIISSSIFNINDDKLNNGKNIFGKLAAQVPYYQSYNALLRLDITSISKEFYKYQLLVLQQSQTSGGLADTPPAPIIGNVRNLDNPQEPVVGYFAITSNASKLYKLDRTDTLGNIPISLFNHPINPEPVSPFRPPLAPCVESPTRTQTQPIGW